MAPKLWNLYLISLRSKQVLATVIRTRGRDYLIYCCLNDNVGLDRGYDFLESNYFTSNSSQVLSIRSLPNQDLRRVLLKINYLITEQKCFSSEDYQRFTYEVAFVLWVEARPKVKKLLLERQT